MKQWKSLVVAVAAVLLGGCTWLQPAPSPDKPEVSVGADGKIAVAPEPLDFTGRPGETTITWTLPKDSPYRFSKLIAVEDSKQPPISASEEFVDWKLSEDGKTMSCRNVHRGKGRHKYTIYLRDAGGKELPPFDPHIHN